MPAAPAAPPPAAPAAPAAAAPAAAPKITIGATPTVSPAMQRSFDRMQKFAKPDTAATEPADAEPQKPATPDPKAKEPVKEPEQPAKEPVKDDLEGKVEPESKETSEQLEGKEAKEGDGKSAPSWKLVQTYKAEAKALKKELAELRNGSSNLPQLQEQLKSSVERAESAEKRAKELSDHMRFLDYQRSDEFVKNHQQPWERACAKAAKDLAGLNLSDANGNARKATINDLMSLCSMELGQAREQADAWFGSSADDVMDHRRKLNELMESQQLALDDAKKNGEERYKTQSQSWQKLQEESANLWQKFNKEDAEKYDFLKPKEGDTEFNERLEKAKGVVEKAFSGNALDPKLSAEDRAKIIRAQVAVRNRAIGYSTLKLENTRLQKQLAEKDKALKEFQGSEPTPGRGKNGVAPSAPADPMAAAMARMKSPKYVT